MQRFRRSFVHLQNWFPPKPWQGKGTWLNNNLTEKLNVHFYCAIYKTKQAHIKHKTHRGSYPQWFEDKKKTDRCPITAIMVKTSFVAAHFSSRGQRPILMSTLRNIFVHMVPGDTKFLLGNIDLNLNWQCLGLTIICRSKGMYVNITPIISEQGGGLSITQLNLLVTRDHLHRIPTQWCQVGVDAQVWPLAQAQYIQYVANAQYIQYVVKVQYIQCVAQAQYVIDCENYKLLRTQTNDSQWSYGLSIIVNCCKS